MYLAVGAVVPNPVSYLKVNSVSLGTDFSIMRQPSAISLVCDGSSR